jgi:hypothetical protein
MQRQTVLRALERLRCDRQVPSCRSSEPPIGQRVDQLRPMTLDFLERDSEDDLKRLAELRYLAREALEMASSAGVLWFATLRSHRAWIVTDCNRFVAEARRLDGQPWAHIDGAKSWTLPGGSEGRKSWPIGIMEAENSRAIALVEGIAESRSSEMASCRGISDGSHSRAQNPRPAVSNNLPIPSPLATGRTAMLRIHKVAPFGMAETVPTMA